MRRFQHPSDHDPLEDLLEADQELAKRLEVGDVEAWRQAASEMRHLPGGEYQDCGPPSEPTDKPPGTDGKFRVLEQRFARHEALWHEQDRQGLEGCTTVYSDNWRQEIVDC